MTKNVSIKI